MGGAQGDEATVLQGIVDTVWDDSSTGEMTIVVIVNLLWRRTVHRAWSMQRTQRFFLFGVDAQQGLLLGLGVAAQPRNVPELLITLLGIKEARRDYQAEGETW